MPFCEAPNREPTLFVGFELEFTLIKDKGG